MWSKTYLVLFIALYELFSEVIRSKIKKKNKTQHTKTCQAQIKSGLFLYSYFLPMYVQNLLKPKMIFFF